MSEIKVNSIKGVGASAAAITVNNSDGTCTANITNKPNRNIFINGACLVAQRGVSLTGEGYLVDRIEGEHTSLDESPTYAQVDVSSGTTPYTLGFRKALKITNGNQTSGVQAATRYQVFLKLEGQDVANSGWNYTSSSSYITLQFWVKSSVSQNFYGYFRTIDGTGQKYVFETGTLSANTWTKITKTIPGNSNITIDNDNGHKFQLNLSQYFGTNMTDSGVGLNSWAAYAGATRTPPQTTTWYTTNDSTLEYTGFQLEVGSVATDFEHRSYAQELALCERYFQIVVDGSETANQYFATCFNYNTSSAYGCFTYRTTMRTTPSLVQTTGSNYYKFYGNGSGQGFNDFDGLSHPGSRSTGIYKNSLSLTAGQAGGFTSENSSAKVSLNAEL